MRLSGMRMSWIVAAAAAVVGVGAVVSAAVAGPLTVPSAGAVEAAAIYPAESAGVEVVQTLDVWCEPGQRLLTGGYSTRTADSTVVPASAHAFRVVSSRPVQEGAGDQARGGWLVEFYLGDLDEGGATMSVTATCEHGQS